MIKKIIGKLYHLASQIGLRIKREIEYWKAQRRIHKEIAEFWASLESDKAREEVRQWALNNKDKIIRECMERNIRSHVTPYRTGENKQ